jgi:hypothetical protein
MLISQLQKKSRRQALKNIMERTILNGPQKFQSPTSEQGGMSLIHIFSFVQQDGEGIICTQVSA